MWVAFLVSQPQDCGGSNRLIAAGIDQISVAAFGHSRISVSRAPSAKEAPATVTAPARATVRNDPSMCVSPLTRSCACAPLAGSMAAPGRGRSLHASGAPAKWRYSCYGWAVLCRPAAGAYSLDSAGRHRKQPEEYGERGLRYISTRQTGGRTVSFEHALLQGLCPRRRALYLPERWPDPRHGHAQGPRRSPLRRCRRRRHGAVHRARLLADAAGGHRGGKAMPTSITRRPRRWCSSARTNGCLSSSHGPTLAFKDFAATDGGPPAGRRAGKTRAAPRRSSSRPRATQARRRSRPSAEPRGALGGRAPPGRSGLRDATPPDDDGGRAQRTQRRHRRHLRRLPGAGEGALRRPRAPRRDRARRRSTPSTGPGSPRRRPTTCTRLWPSVRRRARSRSPCPRAISATSTRATPRGAWAFPSSASWLATNRNDILARFFETGLYRKGQVHRTLSPSMDIQVASNFERLLADLSGRDGAEVREADGRARPRRRVHPARRPARAGQGRVREQRAPTTMPASRPSRTCGGPAGA